MVDSSSATDSKPDPNIAKLLSSLSKSLPIETEEISLIDKFIYAHQMLYELPAPAYKSILVKIVENRINNKEWEGHASAQHQLRVL